MGRIIHRPRRPLALVALGLFASGCTVESPELPSYETEWLVPIGRFDETVLELVEDEENLLVGDDSALSFFVEGELDSVVVGDQLDVEIDGRTIQSAVGPVELDPSEQARFDFRLGELYPPAEALRGATVPVPAFTFDLGSRSEDLPGFRSAEVASGGIELALSNGLPVPVGGPADPERIRVRLLDPESGLELAAAVFDAAVAPGTLAMRTLDLGGTVLPDSVSITIRGGSPGSGGGLVTVDPDAQLGVAVRTTPLTVTAAEAEIGPQSFAETTSIDLPDSVQVLEARVGAGALGLDLRNDLPLPLDATLSLDAFVDPAGDPLRVVVSLPPGGTARRDVDLAGYRLDLREASGQTLDVVVEASSPGSGGQSVWIQATDELRATLEPITLSFDELTGVLDPQRVTLEESETTLDIPDELDDLQLGAAELRLDIHHGLGLPARIDLDLLGENAEGGTVPMAVSIDLPPAPAGRTVDHVVVLDESNSDILPFLNHLPTRVWVNGVAVVGDGITVGTVSTDDALSARYTISAPMTVAVLAQSIDLDPEALDLDEDLREQLERRLISAQLEARVESTLPVAATAWIGIDEDPDRALSAPRLSLGPIVLPAAGPSRGVEGRLPVVETTEVVVEEIDIPVLTTPGMYQAVRLEIEGTDGNFVTLRATDAVVVTGFLRARIRVGKVD